ncbi:MAG: ATP-binding protein [Candidatus Eisenbacteria bacterium]
MDAKERALFRSQGLLRLDRELEGISIQTSDSRFLRSALRTVAECLEADLAMQVDYSRSDIAIDGSFQVVLTPGGQHLLDESRGTACSAIGLRPHRYTRAFEAAAERIVLGRPIGDVPQCLLVAVINTASRRTGALGFVRHGRDFSREELRWLLEAAERVEHQLTARERERARRLRERISAKIFSELRPKDVLYQTLHGLKKLFRYDHSGAVLLIAPGGDSWTVQAEIVTWTKGKSERIGLERTLDPEVRDWLAQRRHPILIADGAVHLSSGHGSDRSLPIPEGLLRSILEPDPEAPAARSCLLGVLRRKDQLLGVIQLFGRGARAFTTEDERTLLKFLPLAAATVYNSELYAAQHERMVSAERKVGLGELARAISHDLNNAFGVFLPLLQTMRRDIERAMGSETPLNAERLKEDVDVALHYAGYSARIFEGLLSMGRGPTESFSWIDPNPLVETTLAMVSPSFETRAVRVETSLEPVPRICARRGELEQLFLNLLYNARDAMPNGGTLRCATHPVDGGATIEFADTGTGISDEIREKIFEPFFTTKREGTGLGLDICRSIVWEYGGRIELAGHPEGGTIARVWLPPCTERIPEELRRAHGALIPAAAESRTEPTVGFRTKEKTPR